MGEWFLKLIGVGDSVASQLEGATLHWQRPQWALLGMVALLPLAWFVTRRHALAHAAVAPRLRRVMNVCRVGVMIILLLVIAGPYVAVEERIERRPVVAVLIDDSLSMSLPAGPFGEARVQAIADAIGMDSYDGDAGSRVLSLPRLKEKLDALPRLAVVQRAMDAGQVIETLSKRFDVRTYRVASTTREQVEGADPARPAVLDHDAPPNNADEAVGPPATALGAALERVHEDAAGKRLAGVLLLSDGRTTAGPNPVAVIRRLGGGATSLVDAVMPVFAVPPGSGQAAMDVEVVNVIAPNHLAKDDTAAVIATVTARGFAGRDAQVKLMHRGEVIDTKPVRLAEGLRQRIRLSYKGKDAGRQTLRVRIDPMEGEQVHQNNEQPVTIEVDSDRQRVLYLEGHPRWDFRFLDHALRRDKGLDVQIVMASQLLSDGATASSLRSVNGLPRDREGFAGYALVILGDVTPDLLSDAQRTALLEAVEKDGVGLLVQAGPTYMPTRWSGLGDALPVRLGNVTRPGAMPGDGGAPPMLAGLHAPATQAYKMRLTPAGALHPAFVLFGDARRDRALWDDMPGFYWAAETIALKPGASALAEVDVGNQVRTLMAEHRYGKGRVFFVGIDATYRWRRNIGSHFFYRFWGQAFRHVARRRDRNPKESWVEVSPQQASPGETVNVTLYAVDAKEKPLKVSSIAAQMRRGDDVKPLSLKATDKPGVFKGSWSSDEPGDYELTYRDAKGTALSTQIMISGAGKEMRRPIVDRDALSAIADASGGELIELEQLRTLPERLAGDPVRYERTLEASLWDNWLVLMLLVGFYCVDIGVRRATGLM